MSNVKFYRRIRNVPRNKNIEISKIGDSERYKGIESLPGLKLKFSRPYIFAI